MAGIYSLLLVTLAVLAVKMATINAQVPLGKLLTPEQGCGITDKIAKPKIVGGVNARPGAFPWIALVGQLWSCGGALITSRHVLTAAHCIDKYADVVRLGEHDLGREDDGRHEDVNVIKTTVHSFYDEKRIENDIAILTLERDVVFTDRIRPVCLPINEPLRSQNLTGFMPFVAGWGSTAEKGSSSNVLQQLQVPVISNSECENMYRKEDRLRNNDQFRKTVICAGFKEGGKDSCQGDSGGPLMLPIFVNGKFPVYQMGVVSYGVGCARANLPGVYTSVQYFMKWIENTINQ